MDKKEIYLRQDEADCFYCNHYLFSSLLKLEYLIEIKKPPTINDFTHSVEAKYALVTCTGFEPVNAAVKGRCVKPLHQQAI